MQIKKVLTLQYCAEMVPGTFMCISINYSLPNLHTFSSIIVNYTMKWHMLQGYTD